MIKKILLTLMILSVNITIASATSLKVISLDNFSTKEPAETIRVQLIKENVLDTYELKTNTVLNCKILKVINPKRGKRNATFWIIPESYTYNNTQIRFEKEYPGRYSRKKITKEGLKKVPKKAALIAGDICVFGISEVYSFGEGMIKNEKDNRLKSGVVNAYENSPLAIISAGEHLNIKKGDEFSFKFKIKDNDKDEDNDIDDEEFEKAIQNELYNEHVNDEI